MALGNAERQKMLSAVIGKMKKDKGMPSSSPSEPAGDEGMEGDENTSDMGKESAAEAMMSAIKSGDAQAFSSALEDFVEMCKGESDAGE